MSTTSVAVVYAVMLEFGFNTTEYGKTILAACFITDLGTVVALGLIALWERVGWWHMVMPGLFTWEPYFLTLVLIDATLWGFIFLITWRIARRFGWRGLAVFLVVLAVIGPLRDEWYMRRFPEWGSYGPGIAPVLAISVSYVVLVLVGHGVMRLVAGPAREDRLARRPWESA